MYHDRTYVRIHPVKVSLNEHERNLIEAAAAYKGMETAAFVRELVMEEVARSLHIGADSGRYSPALRATEKHPG